MILVMGGTGQVGGAVQQLLQRRGTPFTAPPRAQADLARLDTVRELVRRVRPTVVINCAAYTAVDRAESEPELARLINGAAPGVLAEEAARLGALLIHYSTDYVFDGSASAPYPESAQPQPLSEYGRSKLAGEQAVAAAGGQFVILRTGWVYGPSGRNFLLTMRRLFREREQVRVVDDQFGAPTAAGFLAAATLSVIDAGGAAPPGIYHVAAAGHTTWCGFAKQILRLLSAREPLRCREVVPVTTAEYPTPARRPRWSVLDTTKFERAFGLKPPAWEAQLEAVARELPAA